MNDDLYNSWLSKCRSVEPGEEFTNRTLARMAPVQTKTICDWIAEWLAWVSISPAAQTALILLGFFTAMTRIILITEFLFLPIVSK